ncbi:hypothetical protein K388_05611 [Streptomyces sp. KhCrAH-43]|uniref:hypothetical protein n=1 Tax=unclassified Streptomyces TaxID=2593676 RepID=UPI0003772046|nr:MULTISPECIES: hypothetical protein [unclassified Streptomyces]MYX67334.1 hypothetical protein [Streptomyces sp. SID8373]RAJ53824.1 hypothetical protein K388_05611 [Streptomyces sp. KhCrAH-43]
MSDDDAPDNVVSIFDKMEQAEGRLRMIELWEAVYVQQKQSLTDERTAASLHVAVDVMTLLLNGAAATGMITESQRDRLLAIFQIGHLAADEFQK